MGDDETFDWLREHDPLAAGVYAEEYRRRTGIQSLAAEKAEICRHAAEGLADELTVHCRACSARLVSQSRTVA